MGMKTVKKTAEYVILQRGDDRYAVKDAERKPVNGEEKVRILLQEGLIKAPAPKAPAAEEPVEEAAEEEAAAEEPVAEEPASEEPAAEEAPEAAADDAGEEETTS